MDCLTQQNRHNISHSIIWVFILLSTVLLNVILMRCHSDECRGAHEASEDNVIDKFNFVNYTKRQ
jgi:hypothetical protein